MSQRNKLITPPAVEPVSLAEAKQHCRVDFPDDDELLSGMILAARQFCEKELRRAFITQTWETYLDGWYRPDHGLGGYYGYTGAIPQVQGMSGGWAPFLIEIDNPDLLSVVSITYLDPAGSVQTLDPAMYQVELGAPGRIHPAYGQLWPAVRSVPGTIVVRYTCGYGPAATDVPEPIRSAIKLMTAGLYDNRDPSVPAFSTYKESPTFQLLLSCQDWGGYP